MIRMRLILGGAALLSAAVLLQAGAGDDVPPKPGNATNSRTNTASQVGEPFKADTIDPENRKRIDTDEASTEEAEADLPAAEKEELFSTAEKFVHAYNSGDARSIANLFSPNAEYIDEQGYRFHGRAAIERAFVACFSEHKGARIEVTIHSIRLVAPGAAIEEGTTLLTSDKLAGGPIETNYTATHVKTDGQWQTVSVRESSPKGRKEHKAQLQQLSWLVGDWVDEGEDTLVVSSCKPIQGGTFLLREFKLHVGGAEIISGEQRIGWDPPSGKLKSWVFDSDGGYSEGFFQHDDNRWILKSIGVSTDGQPASCTTIFTVTGKNTMTWQTVDHEVAGVRIPDSDVVTIVRRAPMPDVDSRNLTSQKR